MNPAITLVLSLLCIILVGFGLYVIIVVKNNREMKDLFKE